MTLNDADDVVNVKPRPLLPWQAHGVTQGQIQEGSSLNFFYQVGAKLAVKAEDESRVLM